MEEEMIALEELRRVDEVSLKIKPVAEWNWTPRVSDLQGLEKSLVEASGRNTTSKSTFTSQQDHGENY
jgi:hypothetical protein